MCYPFIMKIIVRLIMFTRRSWTWCQTFTGYYDLACLDTKLNSLYKITRCVMLPRRPRRNQWNVALQIALRFSLRKAEWSVYIPQEVEGTNRTVSGRSRGWLAAKSTSTWWSSKVTLSLMALLVLTFRVERGIHITHRPGADPGAGGGHA